MATAGSHAPAPRRGRVSRLRSHLASPRLAAALLGLGFGLLLLGWAFADPPGASPDEPAHYIKAVAAGQGDIRGIADRAAVVPGATAQQTAWTQSVTRDFELPGPLAPHLFACEGQHPDVTAACHLAPVSNQPLPVRLPSYVGDYPPTLYLAPGVLMRVAGDAVTALLVGRLASAALVLLLLGTAAALLAGRSSAGRVAPGAERGWALAGLVLAATPMVLFLGSSLNPNGGEIAAAVCFAAACLRLSRDASPARWAWLAGGISGAILATARSLGPGWVLLILLVAVSLTGVRPAASRVRSGGGFAAAAAVLITVGLAAGMGWDVLAHGHTAVSSVSLTDRLTADIKLLPGVLLPEQVGVFGFLDVELPRAVYWGWEALAGAWLLAALVAGSARERLVLVVSSIVAVAVTLAVAVLLIDPTGFPSQGRYTLPFTVVVPLLAGEILLRHPGRFRSLRAFGVPAVFGLVALLQAYSWWQNARRYAVGASGPFWFLPGAQWAPPGGWWTLVAVMLAGIVALLLAGVSAGAGSQETGPPPVGSRKGGRDIPDRPAELVF